jgi:hypothetical protein
MLWIDTPSAASIQGTCMNGSSGSGSHSNISASPFGNSTPALKRATRRIVPFSDLEKRVISPAAQRRGEEGHYASLRHILFRSAAQNITPIAMWLGVAVAIL